MELKNEILAGLNPEQLSAVVHKNGAMLVLAGAGSGKTTVLTTRIGWLVKDCRHLVHEILAVTFTNKAAKEMLGRVSKLLSIDTKFMWVGTFHSIALRLLTKHHKEAGLPSYFQIIDAQNQLAILKRLVKNANLDEDRYPPKDLQRFINSQKEQGVRSKRLAPDGLRQEHWVKLYEDYELMCDREGLVDFTELLLRSYETLLANDELLKMYQDQFKHILVDEFQDTNHLQYIWLKLLSGNKSKIFAVGDDDQSIYSFRGAKVTNMKAFLNDFKISSPITLEQNYRSTPDILTAANTVIDNNNDRIGKNLWTDKAIGEKLKLYEGYTEEDEAYFVADEIKTLENNGINLNEIAILYRSNAQSRIFEQYFYNRSIPYRVYGGLRFFDRQEIKHILSYLRLVMNQNDNDAFLRIVNVPPRGIGSKSIEVLQEVALQNKTSLFAACQFLEGKTRTAFAKFTDIINLMKLGCDELNLSETISYVIEASGLKDHYSLDKKGSSERLENLNELVNAVTNFRHDSDSSPLAAFLAHAVLESGDGQASNYEQAIQLMTVHAAKGLEFKVVFIVGLEDGLFPHQNSLESINELQEERRLMYVAITRARERLYLLRACSRLLWGRRQSAPISRFVNEIPSNLINNISGISEIGYMNLMDCNTGINKEVSDYGQKQLTNPESRTSRIKLIEKGLTIKIGDMVKHDKFGNGKIIHLNEEGLKLTAIIFFIGVGKKTLDLNIAKIEKIN